MAFNSSSAFRLNYNWLGNCVEVEGYYFIQLFYCGLEFARVVIACEYILDVIYFFSFVFVGKI